MKNLQIDGPGKRNMLPIKSWGIYIGMIILFTMGFITGYFSHEPEVIYKECPCVEQQEVVETVQTVEIPIVEEVYTPEPVYAFTDDEIFLMAQLLCGQAGKDGDGEYDFEWQIAKDEINWFEINKVLEVVMNRTLTPGIYADNVTDVIMQSGAFSVMPMNASREPSPEVVAAVKYWCDFFNSPEYVPSIPSDHYWFSGSRGSNITRDHF